MEGGTMLVVKSKIKDVVKNCNVAGDLADALSKKLTMMIEDACKRADENGRKTVMAKDVPFFFTCKGKASDMIVVKSKLKDVAKGYNVAGDLADALNNVAVTMVGMAEERAAGNNRKTLMAKDL